MKYPRLIGACSAALSLPLFWIGAMGTSASAQQVPPPLVQPPEKVIGPQPAPELVEATEEVPLGAPYESLAKGFSFRPPAACKRMGNPDLKFIAEWSDPA